MYTLVWCKSYCQTDRHVGLDQSPILASSSPPQLQTGKLLWVDGMLLVIIIPGFLLVGLLVNLFRMILTHLMGILSGMVFLGISTNTGGNRSTHIGVH